MDRNVHLSETECSVIIALDDENLSVRVIAELVKSSRNAVCNEIRNQGMVNEHEPTGWPRKLADRTIRSIARKRREGKCTARMVQDELRLNVGARRVQQVRSDAYFVIVKSANRPRGYQLLKKRLS